MAFWSNWFSSSGTTDKTVKQLEYNGFVIEATPYKDAGQWQLAGTISKDGKSHRFVRADKFASLEDAADLAISKGQMIVDQLGEAMFKS